LQKLIFDKFLQMWANFYGVLLCRDVHLLSVHLSLYQSRAGIVKLKKVGRNWEEVAIFGH